MKTIKLLSGIVGLMSITACTSKTQQTKSTQQKPNIVYIYFDDMGYGDVSCLNSQSKVQTPNIDRFASEGITFTNAHSAAAVSTPSRYAVITGRYPFRSRCKYRVLTDFSPALIKMDRPTVASMLKKEGYNTALIGKWHLGFNWQLEKEGDYEETFAKTRKNGHFSDPGVDFTKDIINGPNQHGFDYSYSLAFTLMENNKLQHKVQVVKKNSKFGYISEGFPAVERVPAWVERTDKYIKNASKKDKPFFLYYALTAPHEPHVPSVQNEIYKIGYSFSRRLIY